MKVMTQSIMLMVVKRIQPFYFLWDISYKIQEFIVWQFYSLSVSSHVSLAYWLPRVALFLLLVNHDLDRFLDLFGADHILTSVSAYLLLR